MAAATQMLPGPVTMLTGGHSSVPYANIATAWGAADRVDLVHAEQRARRQDGRVRQPAELALRGRGDRQGGHPRLLGGNDVHDHAGGVDRPATGDVQPHAVDGHPPLGDGAAGHDLGGDVGAPLVAVDETGAADRLLQRRPHLRVERLQRPGDRLGGHPGGLQLDPVEPGGQLAHGGDPAMTHVLADGPHLLQGGFDVEVGTGQHVAKVLRQRPSQVGTRNHPFSLRRSATRYRLVHYPDDAFTM
ncbi:hypothetical protein GCM10018952_16560 [Streptosporangium vulgare]